MRNLRSKNDGSLNSKEKSESIKKELEEPLH